MSGENARRVASVGLVLAAVATLAASVVHDLQARPIRSVRIAGEFRQVSQAALEAAISAHLERGFFRVDVEAVRDAALGLAWIRDASVRRVWPESLHVAVVERSAVARWNDTGVLEADGAVFHPEVPPRAPDLPQLAGPPGSARLVLAQFESLNAALANTPVRVRRLALDRRGAWRAVLDRGVPLVLGHRPSPAAVQRLAAAWAPVVGDRFAELRGIDMRYANGFAVRWHTGANDEEPAR